MPFIAVYEQFQQSWSCVYIFVRIRLSSSNQSLALPRQVWLKSLPHMMLLVLLIKIDISFPRGSKIDKNQTVVIEIKLSSPLQVNLVGRGMNKSSFSF